MIYPELRFAIIFPEKNKQTNETKKKTKKQKKNSSLCIESYFYHSSIGHFGKYHNTLCLSPQILHEYCFQFLLELTVVTSVSVLSFSIKFKPAL